VTRIFWSAMLIAAALRADSLEAVLHRMDEGAKKFKSVAANLKRVNYNAVLQESTTQTGDLKLMRRGKSEVIGVLHFNPPDETSIGFSGHTVRKYYPNSNQVDVFDIGKNAAQIDQFILLTFGAAGSELTQSYELKLAGSETVDGTRCSHLVLIPKAAEARKYATQIDMWIPEGKSYAIQEKVTQPSGNYDLNTYSDIKMPANLPDSAFELKYPSNAKVINLK
jgi:outer membrane lipoprotein-sorting protein